MRIVDEETSAVIPDGSGRAGELVVRSSLTMRGYWNKPDATAKAMLALPGEHDEGCGWLRTGDVATLDGEGYLQLVDRKKDIIIRGGENISCSEVENAFYERELQPAAFDPSIRGLARSYLDAFRSSDLWVTTPAHNHPTAHRTRHP